MLKRFRAFAIIIGLISLVTLVFISHTTKSADLQTLLNDAPCGTTISLPAGSTFIGNFRLRNKGCTASNPITITTAGFNVPEGQRVKPSDDGAMAGILTPGNGLPVIEADAGAGFYRFIGLYISVNYGSDPNKKYASSFLIRLENGNDDNPSYGAWLSHDITFDRCHVEGKFGDSRFAIVVSGFNFTFKDGIVDKFANPPGNDSAGFWFNNAGGHLIENSLISAGMWCIDMGGADSDSPNRARVASSSTTSVTLSDMEGIPPVVGDLMAFYIRPSGGESTWQANTNYPLGTLQFHHSNWTQEVGKPPLLFYTVQGGVSGNIEPDWSSFDEYHNQTKTDGSVTWRLFNGNWQVGKVTAVSGNTVTFEPHGPTGIFLPPVVGSITRWNGYSPSLTVRRSHFLRPAEWANFNAPNKGMVQIKNGSNLLWEANFWEVQPGQSPIAEYNWNHRPGLFALTPGNQSYSAPWSTDRNIIFRYNVASHIESVFNFALIDYTKTNVPGGNIVVEHNLFKDVWHGFVVQCNGGFNVRFSYNTVLNQSEQPLKLFNSKIDGLVFENNIVGWYQGAYLQWGDLYSTNVNGGREGGNVFVDVNNRSAQGYPPTMYFPNSYVAMTWVAVKIQPDGRLAPDSPFKGKGTNGTDPGANIDLIEAAMAGNLPLPDPTPTPTPTPSPSPSPVVSPSPSPTPSTSTRFLNGYVKVNGLYFNGSAVVTSSAGQSFTTQPGGYFELQNIPLGSVLSASAPGYTFPTVTVDMAPYFIIDGSSVASPTPTPLPSPSPSPTATPTPTPTPSPTPLPSPTPGPTPSCRKFNPKRKCVQWSL